MKILHTSDWHLGQTFHDYDRSAEHADMLQQIIEIVRDEQPDALLLSGDVFHTGNPTPTAVKMYNSALLQMHDACPNMTIVVTAGNHDSPSRLMVNNDLWDYFRVSVIGNVARKGDDNRSPDFDSHIIEIKDSADNPVGYVAAVPHCYESNFPCTDASLQRTDRAQAYFKGLLDAVKERNTAHMPVVLMAHMAVNGCDFAGHDNIGGMETRDLEILGNGYDYVALGHIHTPHNISDRVRYCGTPVPVNFGERFEHSVSVVTLNSGELPKIATRRIKNLIPLHDFPSQPAPFSQILESIKDYDSDELCYLRILIRIDPTMTPLANTLLAEAVKDKKCRICKLQLFEEEKEIDKKPVHRAMTGSELRTKEPLEIAEMFFEMKGLQMSNIQKEIIKQATIKARTND